MERKRWKLRQTHPEVTISDPQQQGEPGVSSSGSQSHSLHRQDWWTPLLQSSCSPSYNKGSSKTSHLKSTSVPKLLLPKGFLNPSKTNSGQESRGLRQASKLTQGNTNQTWEQLLMSSSSGARKKLITTRSARLLLGPSPGQTLLPPCWKKRFGKCWRIPEQRAGTAALLPAQHSQMLPAKWGTYMFALQRWQHSCIFHAVSR